MKATAYLLGLMAIIFIGLAILHSNPSWVFGAIGPSVFAYNIFSKNRNKKKCNTTTKGHVLNVYLNGTYITGQPLNNAEIAYLDRVKEFKDLSPGFIHQVSIGDIVEINYSDQDPDTAQINYE